MKICSKCRKPFNEPHQYKTCNACREYQKQYNSEHHSEILIKKREYHKTHHEEGLIYDSQYLELHREEINAKKRQKRELNKSKGLCIDCAKPAEPDSVRCIACTEKRKQYYNDNKDSILAKCKQYVEGNKPAVLANKARYYIENRERLIVNARRNGKVYRQNNPETIRAKDSRRRARLLNAEGTHTAAEIKELAHRQANLCFYCHTPFFNGNLKQDRHVEHKIPLSRGGADSIDNIVLSCSRCNYEKSTKTHEEFLQARNA